MTIAVPFLRRKQQTSPTAIHAIADRLAPEVRARFLAAVEQLRDRVNLDDVARYLEQRDHDSVLAVMRLSHFPHDLQPMIGTLQQIYAQAGTIAAEQLSAVLTETIAFDRANPLAVAWARQYSARLVTEITDTTRAALRTLMADAVQAGSHPYETARALRSLVGLTERQVTAVANYRAELEGEARAAEQVGRMVDHYAQQLLTQRAKLIARTETIRSSAEGQLGLWKQAAQRGLLDPAKTQRVWITTEDARTCPICEPMDGQTVAFDAPFVSAEGDEVMTPPVHVACRCAVALSL